MLKCQAISLSKLWREKRSNIKNKIMWNTIKKILQNHRGTCIIVEEGKPAYVVLKFDDYQKFLEERNAPVIVPEDKIIPELNEEITSWTDIDAPEKVEEVTQKLEEVKIEDLPL